MSGDQSWKKVSKGELGLRFGCGSLMGVLIGLSCTRYVMELSDFVPYVLGSMLICGLLAVFMGDRFYTLFQRWGHPY